MNKLQIYKASAGSGKTYLLTENFLKLALENPDNFSKILAVTFTNKASEEMKTRILDELNNLINFKDKANHFASIKRHLNFKNDEDVVKRANIVRDNILHNYSLFHISTIDSFVQKVIRAFSYEMNLSSGYDIELDTQKVIDDLTDMLYKSISDNKHLQKWLLKYAEHKINDGKNWDFREEIKKLAYEIFKEKFQELYFDKNNNENEREKIEKFLALLNSIKKKFEKKMDTFSLKYKSVIDKKGINYESLGNKFKIISNHFYKKIPSKIYDDINQTLIKSLDGIENWHKQKEENEIIETIESVINNLLKIVEEFFDIFKNESEEYYSAVHVLQSFHSFGILNDLAAFLPEYRSENNLLLISDTTLLLKKIIGDNDAPFIYEKIGNRFKNILIDEFQDTSGFQWENFKPLIMNSLSQGLYNLIVGDIKQSIYRWRGGDWKLLLSGAKKDIGELMSEDKSLDINWRSKKNIIQFNNAIFDILPSILQKQYNNKLEEINNSEILDKLIKDGYNKVILDAYEKNCQKVPESKSKLGGKVKITFRDKDLKIEDKEEGNYNFPEMINNLLKNDNYNPKDIGILVRKNLEAKEVVDLLLDYQTNNKESIKYQIISADSLHIGNSSIIKLLISAMKYIHNQNDTINIAQLVYEYQKKISENDIDFNEIFLSVKNNTYKDLLPNNFVENSFELSKLSTFEISEKLIRLFALKYEKEEFIYIRSFQDVISDFTRNKNSDLSEFLRWWDEKGRTKSVQISDKVDAIKVMTIHKSKGLAFNVVIMPFANWSIDHFAKNAPLLWTNSQKSPFNQFEYLPIKYSKKLINTYFSEEYFNENLFANTDAINMLYVAFTRAIKELHIYSYFKEPAKKETEIKDIGQLLYKAVKINTTKEIENCSTLINLAVNFDASKNILLIEDEYSKNIKSIENNADLKIVTLDELDEYPNNNWQEKVKINYGSEDFFIESIEAIEEKVNYGTLMHKIFAEIKTSDDIEDSLKKMYLEGYITKKETEELKLKIEEVVSRKNIKDWFSDKYDVKNEEALITIKGDIRIPDRVLINEDTLIVIDFKFGKQQEKYKQQILEYKHLIEQVYKRDASAFIYYVEEDIVWEV